MSTNQDAIKDGLEYLQGVLKVHQELITTLIDESIMNEEKAERRIREKVTELYEEINLSIDDDEAYIFRVGVRETLDKIRENNLG